MGKLICFSLLAIVTISLTDLRVADACSCRMKKGHPQTRICKSKYVLVVSINSEPKMMNDHLIKDNMNTMKTIDNMNNQLIYKARIETVFKKPKYYHDSDGIVSNTTIEIRTSSESSLCGVTDLYKPGKESVWLISGRIRNHSMELFLCGEYRPWKLNWHMDCNNCKISRRDEDKYKDGVCPLEKPRKRRRCQKTYGYCVMQENKCVWEVMPEYNKCIQNIAQRQH